MQGGGVSSLFAASSSVEFDWQVGSVLAEELAVVVVDRPEGREVERSHAAEEVLPPAPLQRHQAREAALGVSAHHLQAMGDVGLIEYPIGGEGIRLAVSS